MKDLIFNELTETPLASDFTDAILRMEKFLNTYKARPEKIFNKGIRLDKHIGQIALTEDYSIQNLALKDGRARTLASALLSLGRFPYLEEGSKEEEQYILKRYFIMKNNNKFDVIGLASAYLQNSIAIGFESENYWQNFNHSMTIENKDGSSSLVEALSVSSPTHFSSVLLKNWIENHEEIVFIESKLNPKEKQINLRDDHGVDKLRKFAQRLVRNTYVEGVVNSCAFSPHNRQFIRSIKDNGIIEITLSWTTEGFGMAVQTTGRNRRETEKIADLLQEQFSR